MQDRIFTFYSAMGKKRNSFSPSLLLALRFHVGSLVRVLSEARCFVSFRSVDARPHDPGEVNLLLQPGPQNALQALARSQTAVRQRARWIGLDELKFAWILLRSMITGRKFPVSSHKHFYSSLHFFNNFVRGFCGIFSFFCATFLHISIIRRVFRLCSRSAEGVVKILIIWK